MKNPRQVPIFDGQNFDGFVETLNPQLVVNRHEPSPVFSYGDWTITLSSCDPNYWVFRNSVTKKWYGLHASLDWVSTYHTLLKRVRTKH